MSGAGSTRLTIEKWLLPGASILAAAIFITVHFSNNGWREQPQLSTVGNNADIGTGQDGLLTGGSQNNGDTGGGGTNAFTFTPTAAPQTDVSFVPMPTTVVVDHPVPQIPEIVPTPKQDPSPINVQWNIPYGEPTPDPIYLTDPATPPALILKGDTSPIQLKWNIPLGEPTPDPALLLDPATPPSLKENSSPIQLKWNIPLGEPTPDPAKLGSPILIKWNIPLGEPTPDPAKLGSPIQVKWNIPLGEPTPDPAKLGSPIQVKWNIPFGEPTPDPAALLDPATPPQLILPRDSTPVEIRWNIPLGEPTPDPAAFFDPATAPSLFGNGPRRECYFQDRNNGRCFVLIVEFSLF